MIHDTVENDCTVEQTERDHVTTANSFTQPNPPYCNNATAKTEHIASPLLEQPHQKNKSVRSSDQAIAPVQHNAAHEQVHDHIHACESNTVTNEMTVEPEHAADIKQHPIDSHSYDRFILNDYTQDYHIVDKQQVQMQYIANNEYTPLADGNQVLFCCINVVTPMSVVRVPICLCVCRALLHINYLVIHMMDYMHINVIVYIGYGDYMIDKMEVY